LDRTIHPGNIADSDLEIPVKETFENINNELPVPGETDNSLFF